MKKIGWGIVSTGRISDWFCGDFGAVTDGKLVGVSSRSMASAEKFAAQYDIPNCYDDYSQMLANDEIDVVYIGTPHSLHAENSIDALKAGKAALCEKSLTVNADECAALIKTAEETGGYLMEAMWTYFLPAMQKAKEWVDTGRIGNLLQIKTDFGYPVPYAADAREYDVNYGGGVLLEMGVYPVAIAHYFGGADAEVISAIGTRAPNGVENDVTAILSFGDVNAVISTSFRARLRNAAYIIGDEGYIVIPDAFRCHECFLYKIEDCLDHFIAHRHTKGYEYQAIAVCEDLRKGARQSEIMPLKNSLAFQKTMDAIKMRLE